ncbi:hypothetical protein NHH03_02710 [Stieleria sp. TO1_6]|uniref:hypothetical protein n=1 Tax=Stieleria tagensis TaxID=2956795 RepID=UPI00209A8F86|nr:hypothetical protein [Stieleria tagensis]MCO8120634.1 hypothetical protein [Stieleria tagensis]
MNQRQARPKQCLKTTVPASGNESDWIEMCEQPENAQPALTNSAGEMSLCKFVFGAETSTKKAANRFDQRLFAF